ncbi:hypothetical protein MANES_05G160350v8 [Manihot esculenta]|uniref:Uncharacterized protein n=1 Tax=Manihot esculenta TaxID=3983 RepID=A0ACB7HRS6_MANES|nr:hypothetical protein MANES_05G160350v8 [Manihot esculenta]
MSGALAWQVKKLNKNLLYWVFEGGRWHGNICFILPGSPPSVCVSGRSFLFSSLFPSFPFLSLCWTVYQTNILCNQDKQGNNYAAIENVHEFDHQRMSSMYLMFRSCYTWYGVYFAVCAVSTRGAVMSPTTSDDYRFLMTCFKLAGVFFHFGTI